MAQVERRFCCAADKGPANTPTPVVGIDPYGRHPWSVLRTLLQVAGDDQGRSEICRALVRNEPERQGSFVQHFLHVVGYMFERMAGALPPSPPDTICNRRAEARLITLVRDCVRARL